MMNEKGFSLIGVLISCILLTAITSLLFTQQMIIKQNMKAQNRMNAANIAQVAIESLTKADLMAIDYTSSVRQVIENHTTFEVTTTITHEEFFHMDKVKVIVAWQEWGVLYNVTFETLLSKDILF